MEAVGTWYNAQNNTKTRSRYEHTLLSLHHVRVQNIRMILCAIWGGAGIAPRLTIVTCFRG
ncbi:uncharacterized protein LOC143901227 isoform X3 [Temnothorax americanus]|uniref:uncharacterized protein LOC143901227 isoform X3 n=1 Tax=Temnothorax americanus TaxID=1964332 RepID=UPI0040688711